MTLAVSTNPRKCSVCGQPFIPLMSMQSACGPKCALKKARKIRDENRAKAAQEKRRDRAKREEMKTIPQLIREAQAAFNAYVRARDAGLPCICCGRPIESNALTGGGADAGHYRSTGSASHLRFNEDNCHAQRKICNRFGAGRAVDYRIGLIARIGQARVEALESDNRVHKWTREELQAIRDEYRKKARELKKARQG